MRYAVSVNDIRKLLSLPAHKILTSKYISIFYFSQCVSIQSSKAFSDNLTTVSYHDKSVFAVIKFYVISKLNRP